MNLKSKDLLGLKDLSPEEIKYILDTAATMKYVIVSNNKKTPHLQGKSIVTLFYENSTRTRLSFELASKYMGASSANISASVSSVQKGESLIDTGRTINRMGTDIIIMRHPQSGAPHLMAKNVTASVINAGDGMNEHPTQALLDMFTIREKKGTLEGLKVAILGDIYHSRVARSNIWGLIKMGAQVSLAGPATMLPPDIERTGAKVFSTIQEALIDADVIISLRLQLERQKKALFPTVREYSRFFGLDEKRLQLAKKDVLIMHPGPINRGIELTSGVADMESSAIDEQVTNGVAVRMALLYLLTRRGTNETAN
ncbi:MAG: aspartate carbamoyltransferase catalytic subunit [Clostridiaceae bacterium]|jgi:aspartate carbamoyltransferase catalytic subunit|nr:aspartate carbamoyltransferase catalytic subunit [Clostridiaceae bacterium]